MKALRLVSWMNEATPTKKAPIKALQPVGDILPSAQWKI
jgi:hypothetical protein